tara:strand:+ start:300794 stop:301354 length:561 start_codon:yes stop_codon:yes gene_type:complete
LKGVAVISDEFKCIYLHPPRTGGKTIEKILFDTNPQPGSADHSSVRDILEKNSKGMFDSYFKFAFRRNTWDRLLSIYLNQQRLNEHDIGTFEDFVSGRWVARKVRSQLDWFMYRGQFCVDFVGRFEHYDEDWKRICGCLSIEYEKPPHINKSKHDHYTSYYTRDMVKQVEKRFAKEIKFFGFKFGE